MTTQVGLKTLHLTVHEVEYVPRFKRNLLSLVALEKRGINYRRNDSERYLINQCGAKLAKVIPEGDVLILRGELSGALANAVMIHNVVQSQDHVSEAVHEDTLYNWHVRFGHQSYDAIEALAAKPGSGVKITKIDRPNCMTCAEGKRTKNKQSNKDSGDHSPIDRIGGVICSDLKGLITPVYREKNRYLVNFIDHKTNYCRIFFSEDEASSGQEV
jgi:hypothetical protein